jgi:hypothetical protein
MADLGVWLARVGKHRYWGTYVRVWHGTVSLALTVADGRPLCVDVPVVTMADSCIEAGIPAESRRRQAPSC